MITQVLTKLAPTVERELADPIRREAYLQQLALQVNILSNLLQNKAAHRFSFR